MRKFAIAAVAALWATSADAASVSFGNGFGLTISGPQQGAANSSNAFVLAVSSSVHSAISQWMSGRNLPPLTVAGPFTGTSPGAGSVSGSGPASPTVMPLPGGFVLLAGGLGLLLLGSRHRREPKAA